MIWEREFLVSESTLPFKPRIYGFSISYEFFYETAVTLKTWTFWIELLCDTTSFWEKSFIKAYLMNERNCERSSLKTLNLSWLLRHLTFSFSRKICFEKWVFLVYIKKISTRCRKTAINRSVLSFQYNNTCWIESNQILGTFNFSFQSDCYHFQD